LAGSVTTRSVGLHLNEDIAVYEPVDADIRPVAAGTTAAKLLVTNVINHCLPLIRYELGDELTVLGEANPGPWTGRRIADIAARTSGQLDADALAQELVKALTELGVARPRVSVIEVEEIERTGSTGKLRRFIPLAP
jgi:phenylacetate-CoA ligase